MKKLVLSLLLYSLASTLLAQTDKKLSETIYRSFYNQTITIYPDNPDKVIKKRYGVFIDTTKNSIFCKNLEQRLEFDDYYQSLIYRACRDFKLAKNMKELWSFKDDPLFRQLPKKWFEAQELNGKTYIFCPKNLKNHYYFQLTDSTIVVSKGDGPETYFIKSVKKLQNSIVVDCFQGAKFTLRILDEKTKLAIWKMERKDSDITYRLSVPISSFNYYHMIINHSAEEKIPDDLTFDEIDYENLISFSHKAKGGF